jgi:hypothetical protein
VQASRLVPASHPLEQPSLTVRASHPLEQL